MVNGPGAWGGVSKLITGGTTTVDGTSRRWLNIIARSRRSGDSTSQDGHRDGEEKYTE